MACCKQDSTLTRWPGYEPPSSSQTSPRPGPEHLAPGTILLSASFSINARSQTTSTDQRPPARQTIPSTQIEADPPGLRQSPLAEADNCDCYREGPARDRAGESAMAQRRPGKHGVRSGLGRLAPGRATHGCPNRCGMDGELAGAGEPASHCSAVGLRPSCRSDPAS